uniref:Uncharacterized protein n=1 Tax=Equus caballus TaxID=9796 RepID=A0A9L0REH2_HORSE
MVVTGVQVDTTSPGQMHLCKAPPDMRGAYSRMLQDGKKFDSSQDGNKTIKFMVGKGLLPPEGHPRITMKLFLMVHCSLCINISPTGCALSSGLVLPFSPPMCVDLNHVLGTSSYSFSFVFILG